MRDDEALPVSTPTTSSSSSSSSVLWSSSSSSGIQRKDTSSSSSDSSGAFGRGRYKFWVLAAILLLAFWSMLTGTVTLRWSAGDLKTPFNDGYNFHAAEDLDVLDIEEREKLVKHMWDVYTNSPRVGLGGFWQEAFVAAYEDLTSEVPEVREAAISEIARMSATYLNPEPPPTHSSFSSIGAFAAPGKIQWAPGLPKTRSGKIMRRILMEIASRQLDELGDISTLSDP